MMLSIDLEVFQAGSLGFERLSLTIRNLQQGSPLVASQVSRNESCRAYGDPETREIACAYQLRDRHYETRFHCECMPSRNSRDV
jgi:hypothetical protein